jgi:hypothetical protein
MTEDKLRTSNLTRLDEWVTELSNDGCSAICVIGVKVDPPARLVQPGDLLHIMTMIDLKDDDLAKLLRAAARHIENGKAIHK